MCSCRGGAGGPGGSSVTSSACRIMADDPIRMYRKRSFTTHQRERRPAPAAVCRIPCLILCLAYVKRVCQCRAPNAPGGVPGRMASVIASLVSSARLPPPVEGSASVHGRRHDSTALASTASRARTAAPRNEVSKKPGTIQKVAFQGARVTSDASLILVHELDERLGLEALITDVTHLSEPLLETGERRINADIRPSLQGLRLHLGEICPPSFLASTVSESA